MRKYILTALFLLFALSILLALREDGPLWALGASGFLLGVALIDVTQKGHAVLRNFPLIGHGRYLMEAIRPEINQYFIESNTDGRPFNRELRSLVYQRAKGVLDTLPFGTQRDPYGEGHEWIHHSLEPVHPEDRSPRVRIGEGRCALPYEASILNISAMSFGALSKNAILALNGGARDGGFAHNTGEGGLSPYHLEPGGDLIWQIGTGYFGCRTENGDFDPERFAKQARLPQVRMIEIKLSQGAKPGHGGILPAAKITEEIARIRGIPLGRDCVSPPFHRAFEGPAGLLEFAARLRDLSGGKPVGAKLCVGDPLEILALCKAMLVTGLRLDYLAIDGTEGGTGAAPLEFANSVGMPLLDGLAFVQAALVGANLRHDLKLIAAGKIITGFQMARVLALGADLCYMARGMMFALGCIQALRCNSNHCPVGIATQDPALARGLDVPDKRARVAKFHKATVESFVELLGAAGVPEPGGLRPTMIWRRTGPSEVRNYSQIYPQPLPGDLIRNGAPPPPFDSLWPQAPVRRWR